MARFQSTRLYEVRLEDKVLEPTGIKVHTRKDDLVRLIRDAGFIPVQRCTNYQILKIFEVVSDARTR